MSSRRWSGRDCAVDQPLVFAPRANRSGVMVAGGGTQLIIPRSFAVLQPGAVHPAGSFTQRALGGEVAIDPPLDESQRMTGGFVATHSQHQGSAKRIESDLRIMQGELEVVSAANEDIEFATRHRSRAALGRHPRQY
jgi:hypothetical protein